MKLTTENTRVDYTDSNLADITILEGDDTGVVFRYGRVWINMDDVDNPSLQFDYDILSGIPRDKEAFIHDIAHLLHSMMMTQLEAGEVQYVGGTSPDDAEVTDLIKEAAAGLELPSMNSQVGAFVAKPKENALSFLDRLAAEGVSAMGRDKGILR
jgi:hypothetical protein